MEIRKFRNNYDLELITASHAGINLGDLVWDPIAGNPGFAHQGMPNTVQSAFLDAELISEDEFEIFRKEFLETKLIPAQLADKTVDIQSELITELKHPSLGKIEGDFNLEAVSKFQFGELQVRVMDDLLRVKTDQYLEVMKAKKWEEYDGKIRRVNIITELYYGSIKLIVEKSLSSDFDSAIEKSGITFTAKSEGSKSIEYEFAHEEVPFAMRIEKVRTFNG